MHSIFSQKYVYICILKSQWEIFNMKPIDMSSKSPGVTQVDINKEEKLSQTFYPFKPLFTSIKIDYLST